MKMQQLYMGTLFASALVLTGCGGDDSSDVIHQSDNSNTSTSYSLKYTAFDAFSDVVNGQYIPAWGKLSYKLSNDGVVQTISTLVGNSPTSYQDSRGDKNFAYYAAKNAFAAVPEDTTGRFYKINFLDSDTFASSTQSGNTSIKYTYDIVTIDISGVGQQPLYAKTGIDTDLSYFPQGFKPTFPKSSKCYILLETPAQSYYVSYDNNSGEDITLNEWLAEEQKYHTATNIVREKVGVNNEMDVIRYTQADGSIAAAMMYKGLVYDADYYQGGVQQRPNLDPNKGEVFCYLYNDIAADFFEAQIKANS